MSLPSDERLAGFCRDCSFALAAEHGAESVTVDAISEAAGVSARTFFNYFDAHDDVFVMIGAESSARVRQAVLAAPSDVSPLAALRDAMAAEPAEIEQHQELWHLHSEVLRRSPHLLARSVGAHMADELALAETLAERAGAGSPLFSEQRTDAASPERRPGRLRDDQEPGGLGPPRAEARPGTGAFPT